MDEVEKIFKYKNPMLKIATYFFFFGIIFLLTGFLLKERLELKIIILWIGLGIGGVFAGLTFYLGYFLYFLEFKIRTVKYEKKYGLNNIKEELLEPATSKIGSVYFTKNYFISPNAGDMFICKYDELSWIFKVEAKQNGITLALRIVGYTKDSRFQQQMVNRAYESEINKIFEVIHSLNPDVIIGFTKEKKQMYKERIKKGLNTESKIGSAIQENDSVIQENDSAIREDDSAKITEMREKLLLAIKEKTKIKSYHITPTEISEGDIFMSKFGGLGYWDNRMEYPKDDQGNQLILLAQINFDRDKFDDPNLPSSGLLQFYVLPDDTFGADYDDLMNSKYKVIFHEKVNYDIKKEDLVDIKTNIMLKDEDEYFPFNKELKIEFEETCDYLSPVNACFREVLNDIVKEEFNIDVSDTPLYRVFGEGIMDYLHENLNTSGSKLLGYPHFTQTDPREIEKYKDYKKLLFQMDSDRKVGIMWGNYGIANFFIKESKNFNDILYTWDC